MSTGCPQSQRAAAQFSPAWPRLSPVHDTPLPVRVHRTPPACTLHPCSQHSTHPSQCPAGSLGATEQVSHVRGHGCWQHTCSHTRGTAGRAGPGSHACATRDVPHTSPASHLGPGAGSGPGYSLLEAVPQSHQGLVVLPSPSLGSGGGHMLALPQFPQGHLAYPTVGWAERVPTTTDNTGT